MLLVTLALSANAGQFNLTLPANATGHAIAHPVATLKSIPSDRGWMLAADAVLAASNYLDYQTTYQGPIQNPGTFCENNKLLVTSRCVVNVPKFNALKGAIFGLAAVQWIPPLNRYANWWIPIDAALSVPLVIADIGNIRALTGAHIQPTLILIAPRAAGPH